MEHKDAYTVCNALYQEVPIQLKKHLTEKNKIKPVALAVVELHLAESISRVVSHSVKYESCSESVLGRSEDTVGLNYTSALSKSQGGIVRLV